MPDQPDDALEIVVKRLKLPLGQNDKDEPDAVDEDQAVLLQNVITSRKGKNVTRSGSTLISNRVASTAVDALGHFYKQGGGKFQMALMNGNIYQRQSGDSTWTSIKSGLATGFAGQFIVASRKVYVCDGTNNVQQWDGTTLTDMGNTNASFPKFKFGIYQQNYVICCTGLDDLFYVCVALDPTTWDRTAYAYKVSYGDNSVLMALVSLPLLSNSAFVAFKSNSTHIVDMDQSAGAGPGYWSTTVLDPIHGCVATRTAVPIGSGELAGGVLYLCKETSESGKNFYRVRSIKRTLYGSHVPGPVVSYDIENTLNNMNPAYDSTCCAYFHNNKYIIAFPSASATYPDTVAVLDLTISAFDDGKFRWSLISGWTPSCFDSFDEGTTKFLCFGDASPHSQVFQAFSGTSDNGVSIDAKIQGRAEDGGYPELNKTYEFVEVYFDVTDDSIATISAVFDNAAPTVLGTVTLTAGGPNLPINLPFNLQSQGRIKQKFHIDTYGICRNISIIVEDNTLNKTMSYLGYVLTGWAENISLQE